MGGVVAALQRRISEDRSRMYDLASHVGVLRVAVCGASYRRLRSGFRSHDDLADLSGREQVHRLVDIFEAHLPADERSEIDHLALQQPPRAIPGVEDAASV